MTSNQTASAPQHQDYSGYVVWGSLTFLALVAFFLSVSGQSMAWLLFVVIFIAIYMLPTIIAHNRHHRQRSAITALNIFVGWTFLGWVAALVWSFTADTE